MMRINRGIALSVPAFLAFAGLTAFAADRPALPSDFNVYAITNINVAGSDVEGVCGAGGNVQMSNYSVGLKADHLPYTLRVGGTTQLTDGHVVNGGIESAGSVSLLRFRVDGDVRTGGDLTARQTGIGGDAIAAGKIRLIEASADGSKKVAYSSSTDHAQIAQDLKATSNYYASCQASGTADIEDGVAYFDASTQNGVTVFNVSAAKLNGAWKMVFDGSAASKFIVNVSGAAVNLDDGVIELQGGAVADNVLFNLADATTLKISKIQVPATVLAPYAATTFESALVMGSLYVNSLGGNGQTNHGSFNEPTPKQLHCGPNQGPK